MKDTLFKTCSNCQAVWKNIEGLLADPEIVLAGYQVHPDDLEGGLFFFTHQKEGCNTTLAIPVTEFLCLNDRPLLEKRDKELCIGSEFCVHESDLSPKPMKCECAWVREILQTIKERKG